MADSTQLPRLEDAELAYNRVKPELDALNPNELSAMNVDLLSAASIAIGVADRIMEHRGRMATLPEFDLRNVDKLVDYAQATWFTYITNFPTLEPGDAAQLFEEVSALRAKMLMWAAPLVGAGLFDEATIAKIKEGFGNKDTPSDVVALVQLYRSKWESVKSMCGVTEEDLSRGALIGPAMFALVSRRDQAPTSVTDGSLRARRAWTLLDRAYTECRRALGYLRFKDGDLDSVAPNLRKNPGPGPRPTATEPAKPPTAPSEPVTTGSAPTVTTPLAGSTQALGGNSGPFMAKS